jgi:hypothetical protein
MIRPDCCVCASEEREQGVSEVGRLRWVYVAHPPRHPLGDLVDGMIVGKLGPDVLEAGLRIHTIQLGGLCRAPDYAERF